jgi:hypothetical protein
MDLVAAKHLMEAREGTGQMDLERKVRKTCTFRN